MQKSAPVSDWNQHFLWLGLFFPWDWAGFCCSFLTKEDLFSHQHLMKFFSGSPWPWSFSGRDVGPNLTSKWAASSAFKHLLFFLLGASVWQTFGITCSHYNWGMLCFTASLKGGKKSFPGGYEDVPLLAGAFLSPCPVIKIGEIYFT